VKLEVGDKVQNHIGREGLVTAVDEQMAEVTFSSTGWFDRENDIRIGRINGKPTDAARARAARLKRIRTAAVTERDVDAFRDRQKGRR